MKNIVILAAILLAAVTAHSQAIPTEKPVVKKSKDSTVYGTQRVCSGFHISKIGQVNYANGVGIKSDIVSFLLLNNKEEKTTTVLYQPYNGTTWTVITVIDLVTKPTFVTLDNEGKGLVINNSIKIRYENKNSLTVNIPKTDRLLVAIK